MSVFSKFSRGLKKTRENVFGSIGKILHSGQKMTDDTFDEIEEILISSDMGVDTAMEILDDLRDQRFNDTDAFLAELKTAISTALTEGKKIPKGNPHIILIVGVNGTGKTTSIGKLTYLLRQRGESVLLAAADTFRAAAIDQLGIWAERNDVDIIKHQPGSDPSALVFDALNAGKARNIDNVIIDTAGRLHTKSNLMLELEKIHRVMTKAIPGAPHETLIVLDATTGQNAINQAREFAKSTPLDGIILSKLDGTAKGGVVVAISKALSIPVRYVGLGEKIDEFEVFDKAAFVNGLFGE
jgi:fused signal recognition particle receptor